MKNKRATAENIPPRAARGPYFLTKMAIKIEISRLLTHFYFISTNTPLYTVDQSLSHINLKILI